MRVSGTTFVLLLSLALEAICQTKDYYKILGLDDTASIPEVKRAFRNLAKKFHPDKNHELDAEVKFREILEAYEILSDEEKKRQYDSAKSRHGFGNKQGRHFDFGGGTRAQNFQFDFTELFKQFEDDIFNAGSRADSVKGHYRAHFGSHFKNHAKHSGGGFFDMNDFLHDFDGHFEAQDNDEIFGNMHSMFNFDGGMPDAAAAMRNSVHQGHSHKRRQHRCETVTQKIGNTVTTYTQCS